MSFKCGFYLEIVELTKDDAEANFGFLENVRVTTESTAYNFLHGSCADFAAMLSEVFGYEIECVRNADERLIHAYCISHIGDDKAYIDVRGITTDPGLFFSEFENELTYFSPTGEILVEDEDGIEMEAPKEVWSNKDQGFEGEFVGWDDPEIAAFIKDYTDYYDSDWYISLFRCKACGAEFEVDDEDHDWFECYGEEDLWGHIQLDHPDIYEECQTWETPDMLDVLYDHVIERKEPERLLSGKEKGCNMNRSLDRIISDARDLLDSHKGPDDAEFVASPTKTEPPKKVPDTIPR